MPFAVGRRLQIRQRVPDRERVCATWNGVHHTGTAQRVSPLRIIKRVARDRDGVSRKTSEISPRMAQSIPKSISSRGNADVARVDRSSGRDWTKPGRCARQLRIAGIVGVSKRSDHV